MQINQLFHVEKRVSALRNSPVTIELLREQDVAESDAKLEALVDRFHNGIHKRFPLIDFKCLSEEEEAWIRRDAGNRSSEDPVRCMHLIASVGLDPDKRLEAKQRWHARNRLVHPSVDLFDLEQQARAGVAGLLNYWRSATESRMTSAATSEDIADLLLLIMIKKMIKTPELAYTYLFALVSCSVTFRKGQVVAYLNDELEPIPRDQLGDHNLKPARKIIADREMLYLINRLSIKTRAQIERCVATAGFAKALKRRLAAANINVSADLDKGLLEFGKRMSSLGRIYVPPFLRDLHTKKLVSCPQSPFWEYFFTHKSIPVDLSMPSIDHRLDEAVDRILALTEGELMSDDEFYEFQLECQLVAEKSSLRGAEKRRAYLGQLLDKGAERLQRSRSLLPVQRLQFIFHRLLARWGIPGSAADPAVGKPETIRKYIQRPSKLLYEAYEGSSDWEVSEDRWAEVLNAAIDRGEYDKDIADRLALFFDYLARANIITPLSESIIYRDVSEKIKLPLNQLISMSNFEEALRLATRLPSGDSDRVVLALAIALYFGLRFDEVWNAKYFHFVISKHHISFCVGGRGNDKPKSGAGNRPCPLLSDLPEIAREAINRFVDARDEQKPAPNQYIFHPTEAGHRDVERARFSRIVNGLLKVATGNPGARFHDLRKTSINAFVPAVHRGCIKNDYLLSLLGASILPEFKPPKSICVGGNRFVYWAQACAEMYGHSTFVDMTTFWYLCSSSELYDHYAGMAGFGVELRSCMRYLSRGELGSTPAVNDYLRGTGTFEVPKFSPESTYKRKPLQDNPKPRKLQLSVQNAFQILQFGKPAHMGWLEASAVDNQAIICEMREVAARLNRQRNFAHCNPGFGASSVPLYENSFFKGSLPSDVLVTVAEASQLCPPYFYSEHGLWAMSYRNMGKFDAYVLETSADLCAFLDHFVALGIDLATVSVRCAAGGVMHAVLEQYRIAPTQSTPSEIRRYGPRNAEDPAVLTMGRDINSSTQYLAFFSKAAFVCHLVQAARDKQEGRG